MTTPSVALLRETARHDLNTLTADGPRPLAQLIPDRAPITPDLIAAVETAIGRTLDRPKPLFTGTEPMPLNPAFVRTRLRRWAARTTPCEYNACHGAATHLAQWPGPGPASPVCADHLDDFTTGARESAEQLGFTYRPPTPIGA